MQQAREPAISVERVFRADLLHETGVAGLHLNDGAVVLVGVQIDVLQLAHQLVENRGELGEPLDLLDAGEGLRFVLRMLVAFPGFQVGVGFTDEEHLAQFRVEGVGGEHEDRLLLLDTGEVKQVRVGDRNPRTVGVRRRDVVGVDDGERAGGQPRLQAGAIFDKQSGGDGFVTHASGKRGGGGR